MLDMLAAAALLHPAQQIGWTNWTIHPSVVVGLAAFGGLYLWRARQGDPSAERRRPAAGPAAGPEGASPTAAERVMFFTGLLVMFGSLNGPLHDLSDYYLFSGHMVQHLLLTLVVAPLFIAGTPGWMLRPLVGIRGVGAVLRWATKPTRCFVLFNVVLAAWHIPALYNTALAHHPVHIVQHLSLLAVSVLMWWPILSPLPELPRLAYPGQMLYCFLMVIPMSIVAIYITMADHLLYPAYASAPRLWGISPGMDQQIGGLIMWVPGGLFFYGVMSVVFFKWVGRGEDSTAGAQVGWRGATG
jgi:putative membrane protein